MDQEVPPGFGIGRIAEELRELRAGRVTGTYFIVSDDNRQGRIGWTAGEIDWIVFRGVEGMAALPPLIQVCALRTRFSPEVTRAAAGGRSGLPSTDELLRLLGGPAPRPQAAAPSGAQAPDGRAGRISSSAQKTICDTLADYLGPIATLIYKEHREREATVDGILAALAAEFPEARRAREFVADVRRKLQQRG